MSAHETRTAPAPSPEGFETDITEALRHWTRHMPDREAVSYEDTRWTWTQLHERTCRVANALIDAGLRPGDRFAHFDRNHAASVEITLAASMTGTAEVAVNWRLAPDEVAYVLNDSESRLVIVGEEFLPVIEEVRDQVPRLERVIVVGGEADDYEAWLAAQPTTPPEHEVDPDACVLQLYTSGTTGRPKGAMLTNRGLGGNGRAQSTQTGLAKDQDGVNLIPMPLFHIGGQAMVMISLYAGARMVIARYPEPGRMLELIEQEGVTHLFLVPTAFQSLVDHPDVTKRDVSSLNCLMYSGAPMPRPLLERTLRTFPNGKAIYGGYGMTEISGMTSSLPPEDHFDPEHPERLDSVGLPVMGVEVRVVDLQTGEDCGPGEPGELWVRTDYAMKGYWKNPRATEEAFVDGWMRTGDVVKRDEDGYLYIVGRAKEMIISGGENIYPAEVERVLHEHPAVADGCVIGMPDEKFGEAVLAVVVREPDADVDAEEIIEHCRTLLARYKCPKRVEFVDELPRNTTGKIQKHVLRDRLLAGA